VPEASLNAILRKLPAVNTLLTGELGLSLVEKYGHEPTVEALNAVLEKWRQAVREGCTHVPDIERLIQETEDYLSMYAVPRLKRVINATGIILHTNLGRAVLSERAQQALATAASSYTNLEYDLASGRRGSRTSLV